MPSNTIVNHHLSIVGRFEHPRSYDVLGLMLLVGSPGGKRLLGDRSNPPMKKSTAVYITQLGITPPFSPVQALR